jgi:integrase
LDAKVQADALSWKSAANIWGTATKMCSVKSKRDEIRCRDDNPSRDVAGPDRGAVKLKQYLYPSEFLAIVQCPDVPFRWRRALAVGAYLYVRDGELRALMCEDFDLEQVNFHVHRQQGHRELTPTKGMKNRKPPLEPAVVPLIEALIAERRGKGPLFPDMPSERDMARGLRRYARKAGITPG